MQLEMIPKDCCNLIPQTLSCDTKTTEHQLQLLLSHLFLHITKHIRVVMKFLVTRLQPETLLLFSKTTTLWISLNVPEG